MEEVAKQYSPAERRALFNRFLHLFRQSFASPGVPGPQEGLVLAMQLLVRPMLEDTLAQPFAREVRRAASHAVPTLSVSPMRRCYVRPIEATHFRLISGSSLSGYELCVALSSTFIL